jgi:hypothetical protein
MDTCRSYCLNSRQDDFAELDAEARQRDTTDIHYVIPANDNSPTKVRLTCRALMRFNDCVTCGRQFLLPMFVTVPVSRIFSASVMLLKRAISLATDWPFMRRPCLLSRWVAKHDTQITIQAQTRGR